MYSWTVELMNSADIDTLSGEGHVFTDLFAPSNLQSLPCQFYFLVHTEQGSTD